MQQYDVQDVKHPFVNCKEYNQFYHDYSIMREEDAAKKGLRLVLSACVAKVIRTGMGLLGIEVPERM